MDLILLKIIKLIFKMSLEFKEWRPVWGWFAFM
jgi:hypothetical protein